MDAISLQGPAQSVAFTADFFRCSVGGGRYCGSQARNAAWLRELLTGSPAWQRQGLALHTVLPAEGSAAAGADQLGPAALADYTQDAEGAWARRYNSNKLVDFSACLKALGSADLVIGFELPPSLKRHLHQRRRPYISFHVHALRMLRDLCLGATTNVPAIAALLAKVTVPDEEILRQVRRFRALCKFHRVPALSFPASLPVLIGQTARDSILIKGGRFADWSDCEDALATALQGHDACVFIEHPFRNDSHRVCEYLRCRHGKAVIATNTNGYGALLSTPDIPEVLTLSSSLGVEAQAFGLPTRFLLGDPRQRLRVAGADVGVDHPLGHGVLSDGFWRALLHQEPLPATSSTSAPADTFHLGEHYLRDSLESWSYQLLRDRLRGAQGRRTWMPAVGMTAERRDALLRAVRGGTAADGGHTLPVTLRDPPLALGERRRLRSADAGFGALLGKGFHALDPGWGAWSQPGGSELLLPVEPADGAVLTVTLELRCFEGLLERCPVLQIRVAGQVVALAMFRPSGAHTARVCLSLDASTAPIELLLTMNASCSQAQAGLGQDEREFGFGLTEIELALQPAVRTGRTLRKRLGSIPVWGIPGATGETMTEPSTLRWPP